MTASRRTSRRKNQIQAPRRAQEPGSSTSARSNPNRTIPGIVDGVRDQNGNHWIRYGSQQKSIWFEVSDLISGPLKVFERLQAVDAIHVTTKSQSVFKSTIQSFENYREALVANRPGWLGSFYLFGDGTIIRSHGDKREVIVAFEKMSKFKKRGILREWQQAVAPFVKDQPLPNFLIAYALVGPLLRFTPAGYLNPQVEITGKGYCGKTTAGVLAASVWAGDPNSDCGGGDTWDLTINALDPLKSARRDCFLFQDEGNLAGANSKQKSDFSRQSVFKYASTSGKRRIGDSSNSEHASFALLSTSNTALIDLIQDTPAVLDAAQSRVITLRIENGSALRLFTTVPSNHQTTRQAAENLRAVCDEFWGSASRRFIRRLIRKVAKDENAFRRQLSEHLDKRVEQAAYVSKSPRHQKTIALIATASDLARRWKVFPRKWGNTKLVFEVIRLSNVSFAALDCNNEISQLKQYIHIHRKNLINVNSLTKPFSRAVFDACPGFFIKDGAITRILIPASQFQGSFPDAIRIASALRDQKVAKTERGKNPKLTIKTPRSICLEGRVYCFNIAEF